MANRRMFSRSIIDSDRFYDLPKDSKLLYFYLNLGADDDGFITSPNRIIREINVSIDDLNTLCFKGFVILFQSGACVIRHWLIHNEIKKDRYHPTLCIDEKASLKLSANNEYLLLDTTCLQIGDSSETENRLEETRVDKVIQEKNNLIQSNRKENEEDIEFEASRQRVLAQLDSIS